MVLTSLTRFRDFGLLLLRLGIGGLFVMFGAPKIMSGPEGWTKLGKAMANVGIDVFPMFWGFMASFAECFGGILLILGLFFRPATFLLLTTMIVATAKLWNEGADFMKVTSRPLELAILFAALLFIGPGKYSVDKN